MPLFLASSSMLGRGEDIHYIWKIIMTKNKMVLFLSGILLVQSLQIQANVITQAEILDLELISRSTGEPGGILATIDRTTTSAGYEAFKKLLCNPITKIGQLQNRQQLLRTLQNPELATKIHEQLAIIKTHESAFTTFFNPERRNQLTITLKKNYYQWARLQGWNESAIALDFAHLLEFCALFGPLLEHLILHYAVDSLITHPAKAKKHARHDHDKHSGHHGHDHDHHHADHHEHDEHEHAHDHASHGKGHSGCLTCLVEAENDSPTWKKNLATAVKTGHFIFHLFNIKEMIEHLLHKADVINYIHQEVTSINTCIKACATIGDLLATTDIDESLPGVRMLTTLCDTHQELVMQSLSTRFIPSKDNRLGIFSSVGPTLAAYHLLAQQEPLLTHMLQAAGTVDALMSVNTLLEEQPERYSFAQYQEGVKPYIEMHNFVHPQIPASSAIPNTITLSYETGTDKILITGPNKAGKSSIAKAITANLVLAQTVGIVAAAKALISPMHRIITYINIHDNLALDASMFLAEIMRADAAFSSLIALEGKAPAFALFDDSLFRSTQPAEGEIAAYRFVKKIVPLRSTIALFVTHFEQLTTLEQETNGLISNYHIGLLENDAKRFSSTFQLTPGISPREAIFSLITNTTYQSDLLR